MAISNIWTIQGGSGSSVTMSSLGLSNVRSTRITQAPDTLAFEQAADYDADPLFAYGETVTVQRAGVQWFKGTATAIQRSGSGNSERIKYTVSGPWWQLQQVVYQQAFSRYVDGAPGTPSLARLVIGTDSSGSRLNSGQVLSAALSYAATQLGPDALFEGGSLAGNTEMPYEELNALSCAEVISRVLRWNPDIVAYFDYSQTPPTLNFTPRSELTRKTFSLSSETTITENSINPRNDLQKDGVVIQFERSDTINGAEQKTILTDTAGSTVDPIKTLYFFFDLQGFTENWIQQKIVSESIQENSADWWKDHHPKLRNATNVSVANESKEAVNDGGENDGTSYDKELISGSIADWMFGVGANAQDVEADVSYTLDGDLRTDKLRLRIQGTNANSQNYSTLGDSSPAEPTPVGLAAAIHSSFATLQYEGTIKTTELEVGTAAVIDNKVCVSGGRSDWATMDAQVYNTLFNLDSGETTVNFGPAKHLDPNSLLQLHRNVRTRRPGFSGTRTTTTGGGNTLPNRSPNTIIADDGGTSEAKPLNGFLTGASTMKVNPGTVDGVIVTASGGGSLADTEVAVAAGYQLYLKVTLIEEGGAVQTAEMVSANPGTDTELIGSRLALDVVDIGGGKLRIDNYLAGSQDHDSCGDDHSFLLS
ncbi:MAG: hypothetical protein AAF065_11860 [Verrucomicrobiota bacterium]